MNILNYGRTWRQPQKDTCERGSRTATGRGEDDGVRASASRESTVSRVNVSAFDLVVIFIFHLNSHHVFESNFVVVYFVVL